MSAPRPQRPLLHAALLSSVALTLVALGASPALARPLATARTALTAILEPLPQGVQPAKVPATATQGVVPASARAQEPQGLAPAQGAQELAPAKGAQALAPAKGAQELAPAKSAQGVAPAKQAKEFKEFTLDQQAVFAPGSAAPRYPNILREANITGVVLAMFVVDTMGRVDEPTLKIVRATHQLFVEAVKASLPGHKFLPARVKDRPVKQLVQVIYRFNTISSQARDSVQTVKDVNTMEVQITGNDGPVPPGRQVTKTFTFPAEPLYFVDGKRMPASDAKKIDQDRIASVEVFKGETARAKYGEDGKNGVIVITTKPKP